MSQAQDVQRLTKTEDKGQKVFQWNTPVIWIGVLAFVLVAIVAYQTFTNLVPPSKEILAPALYTNPELKLLRRHAEMTAAQAETDYTAANPELMAATRFSEDARWIAGEAGLHENPELKLNQPEFKSTLGSSKFLSTNPEIKAHLRFKDAFAR